MSSTPVRTPRNAAVSGSVPIPGAAATGGPVPAKPVLRGWLHAVAAPLAIASSAALIGVATSGPQTVAAVIYCMASGILFTTSAVYHRGTWRPRADAVLRRADHTNIYLIIAGSYTPIATAAFTAPAQAAILAWVWCGAAFGACVSFGRHRASRRISTILYIALGWSITPLLGPLFAVSSAAALLIVAGGVLYTIGGIVYAVKRPEPSPRWFGFHEVFHLLTVAAWTCQYIGITVLYLR